MNLLKFIGKFKQNNPLTWEEVEKEQKKICARLHLDWTPVNPGLMIAFNHSIYTKQVPLNGLRHPRHGQMEGWYLWSGGEIPQEDFTFFQVTHASHLTDHPSPILKYLGLPIGYRFQIDHNGYEDVWFDASLLDLS